MYYLSLLNSPICSDFKDKNLVYVGSIVLMLLCFMLLEANSESRKPLRIPAGIAC
jgi:hypothetical protein